MTVVTERGLNSFLLDPNEVLMTEKLRVILTGVDNLSYLVH